MRIDTEDLAYRYSGARQEALADVTVAVDRGETLALLGVTGSGKSTLLALLAGFLEPLCGSISIDGVRVSGPGKVLAPRRRHIGMVFQEQALWPHLTVRRHLEFVLEGSRWPAAKRREKCDGMLGRCGLTELAHRRPGTLSRGEAQRLAVARALVAEPRILLLDEPFSSLDRSRADEARELIIDERNRLQATTLLVTHDHEEALAMADRVAILTAGRLAQVGTPEELYSRPASAAVAELTGPVNWLEGESDGGGRVQTCLGRAEQRVDHRLPDGCPGRRATGASLLR